MHGSSSYNSFDRRPRLRLLVVSCGMILAAWLGGPLRAQETLDREYKVKAAFIYNFLKFVVGGRFGLAESESESTDPNGTLWVGVVGTVPAQESFADLQGKPVKDKRIALRFFKGWEDLKDADQKTSAEHPQLGEMRKCHVLFFCPSEKPFLARALPPLQKDGILLIADTPGFLEAGGVINLVIEEKRVRFEINLAAAARGKLQIRSSLRRLAIRTVEHDSLEEQGHEGR
jgi:hypothetical protein